MNATERLHAFLLDHAGARTRVDMEMILQGFQSVHPELATTPTARPRLRELLDLLELDDRILLPKGKDGWDRSSLPPLPRWLRLLREEAPNGETTDLRAFPWAPELRFLANTRATVRHDDLLKLQKFFANGGRDQKPIPLKERSLQIFGDEKRLDALFRGSSLFADGRLTLEQLRCFSVAEPLAWERGPASEAPLMVIENAATWHSYCRWNREHGFFSAVVYGSGNQFMHSVAYIEEILRAVGGRRRVLYFGDLDPQGLRIPRLANAKAVELGLPAVEPDVWFYRRLLELGLEKATRATEPLECPSQDLAWLGDIADTAAALFAQQRWLPQEHLGWDVLQSLSWNTSVKGAA